MRRRLPAWLQLAHLLEHACLLHTGMRACLAAVMARNKCKMLLKAILGRCQSCVSRKYLPACLQSEALGLAPPQAKATARRDGCRAPSCGRPRRSCSATSCSAAPAPTGCATCIRLMMPCPGFRGAATWLNWHFFLGYRASLYRNVIAGHCYLRMSARFRTPSVDLGWHAGPFSPAAAQQ